MKKSVETKEYKQPVVKIVELKSVNTLLAGTGHESGGGEVDAKSSNIYFD